MVNPLRRSPLLVVNIEKNLLDKLKEKGALHMTLLDPQKTTPKICAEIAEEACKGGTSAIMVGGSTVASNSTTDNAIKLIKERINVPVILFPNNISGISKYADAIWFMSLLNSRNTYYIIDIHALTAPVIKKSGLEVLPLGYLIVGNGMAAGFIGDARGIPLDQPKIAVGYSMAAEMLGMRYIYLEAGSGARIPVPLEMISAVKKHLSIPLIVGGGLRTRVAAVEAVKAGADIIVTGNLVEETDRVRESIKDIVTHIESVRR